ncbi:MAG: tRNA uridine-5-carboxymethylaminomethyl(34) synthesis GTPase MnmE, partial [Candidatus Eisenbacteria bacterium]|nr:tRNA uridine-5-carboxymethylaminomethyl(34) synthesis GTPase MnmE [Candidatus Eisenbacteria bacterium]
MHALDDTIAAIATAPGAAGLAVVRASGGEALRIADAIFRGGATAASAARGVLSAAAGHTLHHGWVCDPAVPEHVLDEVVAAVFRAPRSYTGEDTVEFSCHGGSVPARRVLAALIAAGARLAGPGEYTLRAYLRGRLDLAQAEAVADLVHAETES